MNIMLATSGNILKSNGSELVPLLILAAIAAVWAVWNYNRNRRYIIPGGYIMCGRCSKKYRDAGLTVSYQPELAGDTCKDCGCRD